MYAYLSRVHNNVLVTKWHEDVYDRHKHTMNDYMPRNEGVILVSIHEQALRDWLSDTRRWGSSSRFSYCTFFLQHTVEKLFIHWHDACVSERFHKRDISMEMPRLFKILGSPCSLLIVVHTCSHIHVCTSNSVLVLMYLK